MRVFTVHRRDQRTAFVAEGFSFLAAVLGPLWLLRHRCWVPAIILLALQLAATRLPDPAGAIGLAALLVLSGMAGNDLRRWQLARRGYAMLGVVAADSTDGARLRVAGA